MQSHVFLGHGVGVLIERRRLQFVEKLFADEQLTYLFRLRLC